MTQTLPLAVERDSAQTCPHGTIAWYIDSEGGVLRIFAEPEAHPEDWEAMKPVLASVMNGQPVQCAENSYPGIDIFIVNMP